MSLSYSFTSLATATGAMLDSNFATVGKLGIIPCTASGSNAITVTPIAGVSPDISAYYQGMTVSAIFASNGTATLTMGFGALSLIPVYVDAPGAAVPTTGNEAVTGNLGVFSYDAALNSGNGGWHLQTVSLQGRFAGVTVGSVASITMATITRLFSSVATLTYTSVAPGAVQDQTIAMLGTSVADIVQVGVAQTSIATGVVFDGRVSAAGVVSVRASNVTPSTTVTIGAVAMRAIVRRLTP